VSKLFDSIKTLLSNPPPPKSIDALHREKAGKISDKWSSYLPTYDRLFGPVRESVASLLEIGVQNGGSLETWAAYFPNIKHIVGCDIDERCGQLRYADARIQVVVSDANEDPGYHAITAACERFDIIIDDGSHIPQDISQSFLRYFPHLKPGGIYVIEDTHTLYLFDWRDGANNPLGCYAFFKKLIDLPNHQFWQHQDSIARYLDDVFPGGSVPAFLLEGWVEALEFSNSLIVVRKATRPGHDKIGGRIVSGNEAPVVPLPGAA